MAFTFCKVELTVPDDQFSLVGEKLSDIFALAKGFNRVHITDAFVVSFRFPFDSMPRLLNILDDIGIGVRFGFVDIIPLLFSMPSFLQAKIQEEARIMEAIQLSSDSSASPEVPVTKLFQEPAVRTSKSLPKLWEESLNSNEFFKTQQQPINNPILTPQYDSSVDSSISSEPLNEPKALVCSPSNPKKSNTTTPQRSTSESSEASSITQAPSLAQELTATDSSASCEESNSATPNQPSKTKSIWNSVLRKKKKEKRLSNQEEVSGSDTEQSDEKSPGCSTAPSLTSSVDINPKTSFLRTSISLFPTFSVSNETSTLNILCKNGIQSVQVSSSSTVGEVIKTLKKRLCLEQDAEEYFLVELLEADKTKYENIIPYDKNIFELVLLWRKKGIDPKISFQRMNEVKDSQDEVKSRVIRFISFLERSPQKKDNSKQISGVIQTLMDVYLNTDKYWELEEDESTQQGNTIS